ncbi:uncharacterized protein BDR25DRAFT_353255 [Lindgomyces ingoldianus]|uniref:Uncharacterized protein n=1 Tax=Lindgomyces ingoldianus TaxID=673940 RepID=A0ACB6R1D2_9PLEO|nr:uncharacterized protein BDR25DRAFT_353255 [Lindgomyces ingoldianus]KAF2472946.1 hypothetical protein BDR25DRAFT_353255 [Lindgomyces ingoldianus]
MLGEENSNDAFLAFKALLASFNPSRGLLPHSGSYGLTNEGDGSAKCISAAEAQGLHHSQETQPASTSTLFDNFYLVKLVSCTNIFPMLPLFPEKRQDEPRGCTMMAEALAAVGIASNIIQLVDFGTQVLKRLNQYQSTIKEIPEAFCHIKSELPVLLDALR